MLLVVRTVFVTAIIAFLVPQPAHAQTNEMSEITEFYRSVGVLTNTMVNSLKNEVFRPKIQQEKPSYLPLFESIRVNLVDSPKPVARAHIKGKDRHIDVNVGIAASVALYAQYATLYTHHAGEISSDCKAYPQYLGVKVREFSNKGMTEFLREIKSAGEFCGVPRIVGTPAFNQHFSEIFPQTLLSVMAIVLGHEYGHHLLGHLDHKRLTPEKRQELEADADRFGSTLLGIAGFRAPAAVIFDVLAGARSGDPFGAFRNSDPAECRFVFFLVDDARIHGEVIARQVLTALAGRRDITERYPSMARTAWRFEDNGYTKSCFLLRD